MNCKLSFIKNVNKKLLQGHPVLCAESNPVESLQPPPVFKSFQMFQKAQIIP